MRHFFLSIPFLLLFAGCASSGARYQVNVGNGNPSQALRDVRLSIDGAEWGTFKSIAPNKVAASKPRSGALPTSLTVAWLDPKGVSHTSTLSPLPLAATDFRGQWVVQIEPDQSVTVTPVATTDTKVSILPWAAPEAWEGSIGIPGMDQN